MALTKQAIEWALFALRKDEERLRLLKYGSKKARDYGFKRADALTTVIRHLEKQRQKVGQ